MNVGMVLETISRALAGGHHSRKGGGQFFPAVAMSTNLAAQLPGHDTDGESDQAAQERGVLPHAMPDAHQPREGDHHMPVGDPRQDVTEGHGQVLGSTGHAGRTDPRLARVGHGEAGPAPGALEEDHALVVIAALEEVVPDLLDMGGQGAVGEQVALGIVAEEGIQMIGDQPPQRAEEGLAGAEPRAVGCRVAGAGGQRPGLRRRGWPERVHPARRGRLTLPPSACPRRVADLFPTPCWLLAERFPSCEPGWWYRGETRVSDPGVSESFRFLQTQDETQTLVHLAPQATRQRADPNRQEVSVAGQDLADVGH